MIMFYPHRTMKHIYGKANIKILRIFLLFLLALTLMVLANSPIVASALELDVVKKDAVQGNSDAQFKLGVMYAKGDVVPRDVVEAVRWYREAAEQGHAKAQYYLGLMYDIGGGVVPRDVVEAIRWYREAAEQGHAKAQYYLGYMYSIGEGVPRDAVEAVRWYRMAAERGVPLAQYSLGLMYGKGEGVPKDNIQAYAWMNIGLAQIGDEKKLEGLEIIAEGMTASAITKAQNLSRQYWDTYGPNRNSSK